MRTCTQQGSSSMFQRCLYAKRASAKRSMCTVSLLIGITLSSLHSRLSHQHTPCTLNMCSSQTQCTHLGNTHTRTHTYTRTHTSKCSPTMACSCRRRSKSVGAQLLLVLCLLEVHRHICHHAWVCGAVWGVQAAHTGLRKRMIPHTCKCRRDGASGCAI